MTRTHELKADPIPFGDVASGRKRCEVRQDDRGYQVGDWLRLREHDRTAGAYSGREIIAEVTHIQRGYGLPDGLVVLSIDALSSNVTPRAQGEAP
ncbi:ASCH/PUA domain-containing protein [Azospirillum argentinense]|uniref:ASCH/PUA domain-containing protein n=1 Tax=Azospirillum argentinense TaxID=2970906 RepID=A0ABW8VAM0_9PROT